METLGDFQAVGADILDRRGTHRTGDQRQVFQPRPATGQRPLHEVMPVFPGPGFDVPGVGILVEQALAGDGHVEDQAIEIAVEHQIAAAAENEAGSAFCRRQLGRSGDFLVAGSRAGEGEGVEGGQIDVLLAVHGGIFVDFWARGRAAFGKNPGDVRGAWFLRGETMNIALATDFDPAQII